MRDLRLVRACTAAVALAAVTTAGTFVGAAPASATAAIVTCASLSGNLSVTPITFTLGGCTGTTGGGGTAQGTTITWGNGRLTYLKTPAFSLPPGKAKKGNCATLSDKWAVRNTVDGDTTGSIKVGGKVSASVCVLNQGSDPWSLAPGSVFTLR
jgi:hypothetical protein